MMIRLFIIAPLCLAPWVVAKTPFGRRYLEDLVLVALCGMSLTLCAMVVWTDTIPVEQKPVISVLFISIFSAGSLLFPLGFPKRLIYVGASVSSFLVAYAVIGTTKMQSVIMVWTAGSIGGAILTATWHFERQAREAWKARRDLEAARLARQQLLSNVMPEPIVERLLQGEAPIADRYERIVVIFVDVVGFTPLARSLDPADLVARLDRLFSDFDEQVREHGFTKVKTIGDAYMAVGGLPWEPTREPALTGAVLAWSLVTLARRAHDLHVRAGVHCGPAVAGVVGRERFLYDFWGDTVNVASRLESSSQAGRVQLSERMVGELRDQVTVEERGLVTLKGLGRERTFWLTGIPEARATGPRVAPTSTRNGGRGHVHERLGEGPGGAQSGANGAEG
jgi:class 3 adenylate cyclase